MKILLLGGDKRMQVAYDILKSDFKVDTLGLFEGDNGDIGSADVIVLPVPATRDKVTVNCPLSDKKILLKDIKKSKAKILTCGYDFGTKNQIDYGALDSFCIANAVPTAEGAIAAAIQSTDKTLFDSKILITGFGRVSKLLLSRLSAFSKNISLSARSDKDLALIESLGFDAVKTKSVPLVANKFDIIFNTLDIPLFYESDVFLDTVLFDLSTAGCTGGAPSGLKVIKLPGIPGKTAPNSAGKIIANTVNAILRRENL